jgi:uncharacterized membrane protein YjgN (DUF898 family)
LEHHDDHASGVQSAFGFTGRWQEFLPIALTNLALTIVTLGIYRFWGQVRERKYLWGHSRFIDSNLEWTGTGMELFIGFIMGAVLFGVPFFIINFGIQSTIFQGHEMIALFVTLGSFVFLYYLYGVAKFRALRYRLSRTYWRGIRGGSDDPGMIYGWSYIWKNIVGYLPAGLLIPWSMVSLWNERWNAMSFGSHKFYSDADFSSLMKRYLLFYLSPIIMAILAVVVGGIAAGIVGTTSDLDSGPPSEASAMAIGLITFGAIALIYLVLPLIWLIFYAKFYRVAVGSLTLEKLEFNFAAKTKDWLLLFLGDFGIWLLAAIVTLVPLGMGAAAYGLFDGFSLPAPGEENGPFQTIVTVTTLALFFIPFALVGPFLRYRHWSFFMRHMEAYGEVDIAALTQSETRVNKHGEGLLDALDVGAF